MDNIQIVEQYLDIAGNESKKNHLNKLCEYCDEHKRSIFSFTAQEMSDFLIRFLKITKANTLTAHRNTYRVFYTWGIDNNYIGANIFDEEILSLAVLKKEISNSFNFYYLSDADISEICNVRDNQCFVESLVRLFYEGVIDSVDAFVMLRTEWFDFDQNMADIDGRRIVLSRRLSRSLQEVHRMAFWVSPDGRERAMRFLFKGQLIPQKVHESTALNGVSKTTSFPLRIILKNLKFSKGIQITAQYVYDSGLLNFMRDNCEDEKEFISLILNTYGVGRGNRTYKAEHLLKAYGAYMSYTNFKRKFKAYGLYLQENTGE